LLDYPVNHPNPRPPLFDLTMAIGAHILSPFMPDIDALGNSMSTLVAHYGVGGQSQVVDVLAIEEIFTEKPSLIKIDIEGAPFALLEKSIDVLKAQNCPIYVSIHPHFGIPFNMDLVYDNFNVNHSRSAVRNCFKHTQGIELLLT
jgi:hypothetical protein